MQRKSLREFQRAVDFAAVNLRLGLARQRLFLLAVSHDRRIARRRRLVVRAVAVRRVLVLLRRFEIRFALEQGLGQQEIGERGIRIVRKGGQIAAIPFRRLLIVGHILGALRLRVIVLRHILQIGLKDGHHLRFALRRAALPIRSAVAVVLDELLLALQHQLRKAALRISLDGLHLQKRRLFVVAVLRDERAVAVGRVRVALLLDVQIAEARIQQVIIRPGRAMPHELVDGLRPIGIGERDGHDAKRVFDQFPIGAAQGVDLDQLLRIRPWTPAPNRARGRRTPGCARSRPV